MMRTKKRKRAPAKTGKGPARAEEIAAQYGWDPLRIPVMLMSERERILLAWYEDLKRGIVPAEMQLGQQRRGTHKLENAWKKWFAEAADYLPMAREWAEFWHGKKQRVEQRIDAEVIQNVVSAKPLTREDFEDRLAAARGATGDPDPVPDRGSVLRRRAGRGED